MRILDYHIHIYFSEKTLSFAEDFIDRLCHKFDLNAGPMHTKNVGPHKSWMCNVVIDKSKFGRVVPWLNMNKEMLSILVHPSTGNDIEDHTKYAIWLGDKLELNFNNL